MQAPMAAAEMAACVSSRSHLVHGVSAAMAGGVSGAVAAAGGVGGAPSAAGGGVQV